MSNEVIANAGSELLESRLCSIMETLDPLNDDIRQPDNGAIQEGMETANKLALEIFQDVSKTLSRSKLHSLVGKARKNKFWKLLRQSGCNEERSGSSPRKVKGFF